MSVNTTIITNEKTDVLIVPSGAIKKQGNASFVQVFDPSAIQTLMASAQAKPYSSTTMRFRAASSTASTSARFGAGLSSSNRAFTISSPTAPRQIPVTVGASDDTNTEILSGLNRGDMVVTKTAASGNAQTASAPSILNSLGGQRTGARPAGGVMMVR
jgi:hypothetical protein